MAPERPGRRGRGGAATAGVLLLLVAGAVLASGQVPRGKGVLLALVAGAGIALLAWAIPARVHRYLDVELNPAAAWERRHPEAAPIIVALLAVSGLLYIALHPPREIPDWSVRAFPDTLDRPLVAAILWILLAGLGTVRSVEVAVRRGLVGFPAGAAVLGIVAFAGTALLALGYFLLLRLPAPSLPSPGDPDWWEALLGLLVLPAAAFAWWKSLGKRVADRGTSGR